MKREQRIFILMDKFQSVDAVRRKDLETSLTTFPSRVSGFRGSKLFRPPMQEKVAVDQERFG